MVFVRQKMKWQTIQAIKLTQISLECDRVREDMKAYLNDLLYGFLGGHHTVLINTMLA